MRIVIDLQGAQTGSRHRGIGRYTISFVKELVRQCGTHDVILVLNAMFPDTVEPIRGAFGGLVPQENIRVWNAPGPVVWIDPKADERREFAELLAESFYASLAPDIVLMTSLIEGFGEDAIGTVGKFTDLPTFAILYDLIPLLYPKEYLPDTRVQEWYEDKIEQLKRAAHIFAISAASTEEAVVELDLPVANVTNISGASEGNFYEVPVGDERAAEIAEKYGIVRDFLIYAGAGDYRKNHKRLIEAYAMLPEKTKSRHQLVIAGKIPEENETEFRKIAELNGLTPTDVVITNWLSDEDLRDLYNCCKASVFPSWHEGFGLPVLEAMMCGKAVIASNASSLPEIVGKQEALFDPFDTNSICEKIEQVLDDTRFRKSLERHAKKQRAKFSWRVSADKAKQQIERFSYRTDYAGSRIPKNVAIEWSVANVIGAINEGKVTCDLSEEELATLLAETFPLVPVHKRLFVDLSQLYYVDSQTGIQRVVRSIVKQWLFSLQEEYDVELVYADTISTGYRYARDLTESIFGLPRIGRVNDLIEPVPGDIFLGLDLGHYVIAKQAALLRQWRAKGIAIYFVVYDLLPINLPEYFRDDVPEMHRNWLATVAEFDGAFCISRSVADELACWLDKHGPQRHRPFTIGWFHLGGDIERSLPTTGRPDNADNLLDSLRAARTVLCVGTLEPRKGYAQALEAFEMLWQDGCETNFVIVGREGWKVEGLIERLQTHPQLGQRLFWISDVSDEFLTEIYAVSDALLAPSEGEGFGLPLIEAAYYGLQQIVRNIAVFREVADDSAIYFPDTRNPADIYIALKDWSAAKSATKLGAKQKSGMLTWKQSADSLFDLVTNTQPSYIEWVGQDQKQSFHEKSK